MADRTDSAHGRSTQQPELDAPVHIVRTLGQRESAEGPTNDASQADPSAMPPGVSQIVLNAPERRNALDAEMCAALCAALRELDADEGTRAILLRARGKAFSAGGDLKAMADRSGMFAGDPDTLAASYRNTIQQIPLTLRRTRKPVVALIEGPAIGAGFDLACMCDVRIATPAARFSESFASLGLISGIGGAWFLSRLIGQSRAVEITLTGRVITAAEAHAWGLVHRLTSAENAETTVREVLNQLIEQSPSAQAVAKELFWELAEGGQPLESHLMNASAHQGRLQNLPDHQSRVRKLLKRLGGQTTALLLGWAALSHVQTEAIASEKPGSEGARSTEPAACGSDTTLDEALSRATSGHPSVRMTESDTAELKAKANRSGRQPDPMLMLSRERIPLGFKGQDGVSTWMFGVTQNFLPWSTAGAAQGAADAAAQLGQITTLRTQQGLAFRIIDSLITLSTRAEETRLEEANLGELRKLVPLVQTVYQHDLRGSSHSGLISAEIAQELATLSVSQSERQLEITRAELSYLTGCPAAAFQTAGLREKVTAFLEKPLVSAQPSLFTSDSTLARIAAQQAMRAAQAELQLSQTNTRFGLNLAVMKADAENRLMFTVGVSASLPVTRLLDEDAFRSEQQAITEWGAGSNEDFAADRARTVRQTEVRKEEIERELKLLVTKIKPRAQEHMDALYSDFAQGRVNAREVIEGRRQLLELDRAENRQRHDLLRSQLNLLKAQVGWTTPAEQMQRPQVMSTDAASPDGMGM